MRVAIAQTHPESAAPGRRALAHDDINADRIFPALTRNLEGAVRAVEEAKRENAEVVVFCEYFLQGILNEHRQYNSLPSRHLERFLVRLAAEHDICIVGTIVHGTSTSPKLQNAPDDSPFDDIPLRSGQTAHADHGHDHTTSSPSQSQSAWRSFLDEAGDELYDTDRYSLLNEAFFLDGSGVRGRYDKQNLWHPEREYLAPGEQPGEVFDTKWGKAGFLICWELSHPAAAQHLVSRGADIIFAPMYWLARDSEPSLSLHNPSLASRATYERSSVRALAFARAFETECIVVTCNAGGPADAEHAFMGGSGVWAPLLGYVGGFEGEEVGVRVVDVDEGVLGVSTGQEARGAAERKGRG